MLNIQKIICDDDYLQLKKEIKNGIDINQIVENEDNENEECLIFYALHKKCSFETLKLMVENGVDLEYIDKEGVGILDEAIAFGDIEFIKYLLIEKKIDPNQTKRKSGLTPIIQAACYGNINLVKLLMSYGADITTKDGMNLSALDYARKLQQKKMFQFLKQISSV